MMTGKASGKKTVKEDHSVTGLAAEAATVIVKACNPLPSSPIQGAD